MMEEILTVNNLTFNKEHHLQIHGTAMGTRMAPSFANLFMADLEERLLAWTSDRQYIWWRYIDDVFAIWDKGQERLHVYLTEINQFHHSIMFMAEYLTDRVTVLDTAVIFEGNTNRTALYTKPTDTHQYLSPDSCHPQHCTTSIPYSRSLRIRRICSRDEDFRTRSEELKTHLIACGYQELLIYPQIQKATIPSEETLQPHSRRTATNRVLLVTTYHAALTRLGNIARKHLTILHTSDRLKQAVPQPPLVAFRRPPNLRDLLVRASLCIPAPLTNSGMITCNKQRCKTCPLIVCGNNFNSFVTGRKYDVKAHMDCESRNLVYLFTCKKCGVQYVSETENPLYVRMNGHRSDIRTKKTEKPVEAHFNQPGHLLEDLEVRVIEKIREDRTIQWRRHQKSYWIFWS